MKMTLYETLDMIEHGETPEAYRKRINRIRRLSIERDSLEDAMGILEADEPYSERLAKKRRRLAKVNFMIRNLSR